ncbi:MAG: DEAD/DEAH box helicase [Acidobacteria bacterium]|nr:DEAD/DEAH box helicase [Acidobacteriota bacterium]
MIILHASLLGGRLYVWAEPEGGAKVLAKAVAAVAPGIKLTRKDTQEAAAWLPFQDDGPAPSSPLLGDIPFSDADCYLAPALVTAAGMDAGRAITLLTAALEPRSRTEGIIPAPGVEFCAALLRFAARLVSRGQYLPGLEPGEDGFVARWKPVIPGGDGALLAELAAAMPASVRSLTFEESEDPPSYASELLAREFVAAMTDELVRAAGEHLAPRAIDSSHDEWMRALVSRSPVLRLSEPEARSLMRQVAEWRRPVEISARAPFRLCFRLHEPDDGVRDWQVAYLFQGASDPSLVLPAGDVWSPKKKSSHILTDPGAAREHLIASLGQASGLDPRIAETLHQATPSGYLLDSSGAHQFLRHTAPALEQSGFGVMLPNWWTRAGTARRLSAQARVKSSAVTGGGLTLDTLLEFDWQFALGDERISRAELVELAKQKSGLVKVRGEWVEAGADQIHAALDFLKKSGSQRASLRDLVRIAIGAADSPAAFLVEGVTAQGEIGDLLDQIQGKVPFRELAAPEGLNASLRPYQVRGYSWLSFLKRVGLGACLADDMGLGKTMQTLAMLLADRDAGETRPALLICPTSLTGNWQREAAKFAPELSVLVHHGITRLKGQDFAEEAARHALVVSTYALLYRDEEAIRSVDWAGVILDEAQNIKNPETRQARTARSIPGGYRIALTGTPVENHVGDLWSLFEFLNAGFLGSYAGFQRRFQRPIQLWGDKGAAERLKSITGPFILRRLKTDKSIIADLPEKIEASVICNLTKEQASLYEAVVRETQRQIEEAEGIERKGLVLALLMKLKQVCNHPAQFLKDKSAIHGRSGKLARLTEMIEETLTVGDRSLIFTQFSEMGDILKHYLQETFGTEVLYLHGGTPKAQRDVFVERFAQANGPRIFLLSLKAGGTGLNLTQANHVFHFDRWWNPAVENQATDRAFRIGQTRNVQVHKLVCAGTLEERIAEMIESKKAVAGAVVGTGESWLSGLSNQQLRELLKLRKEAVAD